MTESILSIDPGEVTGWSLWALDAELPVQRLEYGLIKGGLAGFIFWIEHRYGQLRPDVTVVEKWNRHDGRKGDPTHPLQIQGSILTAASALGLEVTLQS